MGILSSAVIVSCFVVFCMVFKMVFIMNAITCFFLYTSLALEPIALGDKL